MTWVRFDDQTARKQPVRAAGKDGRALFFAAAFECAAMNDGRGGDGFLPAMLVKDAGYLAEVNAKRVAPRLVELELWHDHESALLCSACTGHDRGVPALKPGDFFIHEWWEFLLVDDAIDRWRQRRRKALNNDHELKATVRQRDQDRCRYCGVSVIFGTSDRKSKRCGEFDHVDPWCKDGRGGYGNTVGNVVVACKPCNGKKKNRTPEEAAMPLRPLPGSGRDPAVGQISAGSAPGLDGSESDRDHGSPSRDARDGNGPGRSRISAGSDLAGSGSGPGPFDDPEDDAA